MKETPFGDVELLKGSTIQRLNWTTKKVMFQNIKKKIIREML